MYHFNDFLTSTGDFYGLGQTRKRELVKACGVLGVEEVSARWVVGSLKKASATLVAPVFKLVACASKGFSFPLPP